MPALFHRLRCVFAAQPLSLRLFDWGVLLLGRGACRRRADRLRRHRAGHLAVGAVHGRARPAAGRDLAHRLPRPAAVLPRDRAVRNAFVSGAAVRAAVIAGLVFCRPHGCTARTASTTTPRRACGFPAVASNGFYGERTLLDSILTADYKMFMNLFISIPYRCVPPHGQLLYGLLCADLLCAHVVCAAGGGKARGGRRCRSAAGAVLPAVPGLHGAVADVFVAGHPWHAGCLRPDLCGGDPAADRRLPLRPAGTPSAGLHCLPPRSRWC